MPQLNLFRSSILIAAVLAVWYFNHDDVMDRAARAPETKKVALVIDSEGAAFNNTWLPRLAKEKIPGNIAVRHWFTYFGTGAGEASSVARAYELNAAFEAGHELALNIPPGFGLNLRFMSSDEKEYYSQPATMKVEDLNDFVRRDLCLTFNITGAVPRFSIAGVPQLNEAIKRNGLIPVTPAATITKGADLVSATSGASKSYVVLVSGTITDEEFGDIMKTAKSNGIEFRSLSEVMNDCSAPFSNQYPNQCKQAIKSGSNDGLSLAPKFAVRKANTCNTSGGSGGSGGSNGNNIGGSPAPGTNNRSDASGTVPQMSMIMLLSTLLAAIAF
jgi:hypothetical protein